VPNIYGKVPRYPKVKIKAMNIKGKEFRVTAEGFLARIFQHEIDHCHGKLFIDHINGMETAFYKLAEDGKLEPLNYEKDVRNNSILW
jgi:peptide deformylase